MGTRPAGDIHRLFHVRLGLGKFVLCFSTFQCHTYGNPEDDPRCCRAYSYCACMVYTALVHIADAM